MVIYSTKLRQVHSTELNGNAHQLFICVAGHDL